LKALGDERLSAVRARLQQFRYEPIATVYVKPSRKIHLPALFLALRTDLQQKEFAQYVFARAGWLAVVISTASEALRLTQDELISVVCRQLSTALKQPIEPEKARVIMEKRATFLCTPGLDRPEVITPLAGLFLAGDYVAESDPRMHYPATLESAVRAGESAAAAAWAQSQYNHRSILT
jgi:hypothetical protein